MPGYLTVAEYAQITRISRVTIYDAVGRGEIPSIRIGRSIRIPATALPTPTSGKPSRDLETAGAR